MVRSPKRKKFFFLLLALYDVGRIRSSECGYLYSVQSPFVLKGQRIRKNLPLRGEELEAKWMKGHYKIYCESCKAAPIESKNKNKQSD